MERMARSPGGRPPSSWLCIFAVVLPALAASLPCPSFASEALGDLDLRVRLLDVISQGSGRSGDMTGAARIEVIAQSAVQVSEVQLRVLRPDGTAWMVRSQ